MILGSQNFYKSRGLELLSANNWALFRLHFMAFRPKLPIFLGTTKSISKLIWFGGIDIKKKIYRLVGLVKVLPIIQQTVSEIEFHL